MRKSPFTCLINLTSCLLAICCVLTSCKKERSGGINSAPVNFQIAFKAVVDGDDLILGKIYKNSFAEEYSVKTFKFYIHGIELINTRTNTIARVEKNNHYLINPADPQGGLVQLSLPAGVYDRLNFIIGVDSIRNVSGAQTGALDPAQGMFWTWSTGYIMAKLEGTSPVAATPNNVVEYHVGGFKAGESVLRKVTLDFPVAEKLELKQGAHGSINLTANINRWFSPVHAIRIRDKAVSMTPGTLATQIADNYSTMFTVAKIINE